MTMSPERRSIRDRQRALAKEKHAHSVLQDPLALIDGYLCPKCRREFRSTICCPHSWSDVRLANARILHEYLAS